MWNGSKIFSLNAVSACAFAFLAAPCFGSGGGGGGGCLRPEQLVVQLNPEITDPAVLSKFVDSLGGMCVKHKPVDRQVG